MGSRSFQFKVVLLGEGCVGKTSLMLRYINDQFNDKHLSTLQAAFMKKKLKVGNSSVELAIWDTAGQERYHALSPIYYRGSNGAFLVYDITDVDSFQRIKNWVKELKTALGDDCVLFVVGNKSDLEKDRNVPIKEAEEYSRSVGAQHFSTSAKLNKGVQELFFEISKKMIEKADSSDSDAAGAGSFSQQSSSSSNRRNVVQVVDDEAGSAQNASKSQGGCC